MPEAPVARQISIGITSDPPGARVMRALDGAKLGMTPFKESWPLGTGVEELRLELPGYRPEPVVVPLDQGVERAFALQKVRSPAAYNRPAAHKKSAREVEVPPAPAAAPPATVPVTPAKREPFPL